MPALFAAVTLLLVFLAALEFNLLDNQGRDPLPLGHFILPSAIVVAFGIISAFVLAPLAIAVHRFVILGETSQLDTFTGNKQRYLRFVFFAAALALLAKLPVLQAGIEMSISFERDTFLASVLLFARYAIPILSIVFFIGTMSLFPAIAVDAGESTIGNAFADSVPHLGRIVLVVICTTVPIMAIHYVCVMLLFSGWQNAVKPLYAFIVIRTVPSVLWTVVLAATASYIYTCYAQHIGRPPDLAEH